jgi:hypothetical protein
MSHLFNAAEGAFLAIESDLQLDGHSVLSLHQNGDDVHLRIQHNGDQEYYAVAVLHPRDRARLGEAFASSELQKLRADLAKANATIQGLRNTYAYDND